MSTSVICVYNKSTQLEQQLKKSLSMQNSPYELLAVDNSDNAFSSAAEALNYGAEKAHGDILIFAHQDVFLKYENELEAFSNAIAMCESGTIVGAIGVKETSKVYYGNYTEGVEYNSQKVFNFQPQLYPVSSVDECMFGMRRSTWEQHRFDAMLCDNWHLYAVEACLWARKNGHPVFAYPVQVHHFSPGKISLGYMTNLRRLCQAYRGDFKWIWTTCYCVQTCPLYIDSLLILWIANRIRKRIVCKIRRSI